MEITPTSESQPSILEKPTPKAPEWYLFWTFLLSSIAGAIFASTQLPKIKKGLHLLWIWPVSFISVIIYLVLWLSHQPVFALVVLWVTDLGIYAFMKAQFRHIRWSMTALILGLVFAVLNAIAPVSAIVSNRPLAEVGTRYDKNSPTLAVSGTDYKNGEQLYARVQDYFTFKSATVQFMLEKQDGQGWSSVSTQDINVQPADAYLVEPFTVDSPGTYQVSFLAGNHELASTTFTAQ